MSTIEHNGIQPLGQKKVLFLITKSNWGGAQRYVFDLATNLDPLHFLPVVAAGGTGPLIEHLEAAGIKTISLAGLKRDIGFTAELRALWHMWRTLRHERPDVLHINSSKAGLYGALLGRLARVPRIIFTAHGWAFNEPRPYWQRFALKCLHYLTVLLAHETIAVSAAIKAQLTWPLAANRMRVIPLGRTVTEMKDREDARQLLEMQVTKTEHGLLPYHDDVWLGTIAELHPIKNLSVAIDAMAALVHAFPRVRYVVIGEGQERGRLEQQIRHLGLEEHVFLVGALSEAARFLTAFDAFILPSQSEASGYVLLEAGQVGVPVIATNVGGIPELIVDGITGRLVPPNAVDALTTALREFLEDNTRAMHLAENLKAAATQRTLERMVTETSARYLA